MKLPSWLPPSPRSLIGSLIVTVFLCALAVIVWNLHRLQQNQIHAYQALAGNLSETAMNFIIEKQSGNMFEFMAVLSQVPNVQYLAYWVGTQRVLQAGNSSVLNPQKVALPGESETGIRDGRFLYFNRRLSQHEAVLKSPGHFQIVFSLRDFLNIKSNILAAAVFSALVLLVLVIVLVQLNRVKEQLDASQKRKALMISAISHDANNNLEVINTKLVNQLLALKRNLPIEDLAGNLDMVKSNAETLKQILENLSDYERLEERKAELERMDLNVLLKTACRSVADIAERRRQKVNVEIGPGECWVRVDRMLFPRVVMNLLLNAFKFSPEGSTVELRVETAPERVRLLVRDAGSGIPAADREKIFEPYVRLQKTVKGTGLGLTNARQFMRLMGGDLTLVATEVGKGTTFALNIQRNVPRQPL
jgi:signal transduction histidine kinase